MKVVCVDAGWRPYTIATAGGFNLKEGDIYTVVNQWKSKWDGIEIIVYALLEDPDHSEYGYASDRFATLSEIDETEFERNYNFETQKA